MDLTKLEKILSDESGNKFCPICATPFKPRNSRQKTCGSAECKRQYHNEYVRQYKKQQREEFPEFVREQSRLAMRKMRARRKALEERDDDLGRQLEYWEKRKEFEQKIAAYGDKYGEVSAQKTLEKIPKIDTSMGEETNNDTVHTENDP